MLKLSTLVTRLLHATHPCHGPDSAGEFSANGLKGTVSCSTIDFKDGAQAVRMSEIKEGAEEAGERMHAGAKAAGRKMTDPDRDAGAEYQAEKND